MQALFDGAGTSDPHKSVSRARSLGTPDGQIARWKPNLQIQRNQISMTIIQTSPGQYLNSRPVQKQLSCPGGTFKKFTKSYLRTLSLLCDEMPEVKIKDNEMVVNFSYTVRTYTLV
jgi:hypothetical protein